MAGDSRLSARFSSDTTDFKNGLAEINRELRVVESGFKASSSALGDWSNSATGLEQRISSLNKEIDLQKEKCGALSYQLDQIKAAHGNNSAAAQIAEEKFNKETTTLNKMQNELKDTTGALKKMGDQTDQAGSQAKESGSKFQGFGQIIDNVKNIIKNASVVIAGVAVAIKKALDFGEEGAKIVQLEESYNLLIERLGASTDTMDQLSAAARGTVDDSDLMAATLKMLTGTSEELSKALLENAPALMEIAKASNKLNPTMGSTLELYESLSTSIKDLTPRGLKQAGIVIDSTGAYENYARSIGKAVDALTEEEKSMALMNATLLKGKDIFAQVGGNTESATDRFERANVAIENFKETIQVGLMPVLGDMATGLNLVLAGGKGGGIDETTSKWKKFIDQTKQGSQSALDFATAYDQKIHEVYDSIDKHADIFEKSAAGWAIILGGQEGMMRSDKEAKQAITQLASSYDEYNKAMIKAGMTRWIVKKEDQLLTEAEFNLMKAVQNTVTQVDFASMSYDEFLGVIEKATGMNLDASDSTGLLSDAVIAMAIHIYDATHKQENLTQAQANGLNPANDYNNVMRDYASILNAGSNAAANFRAEQEKLNAAEMSRVQAGISGQLGQAVESYQQGMDSLAKKRQELEAKMKGMGAVDFLPALDVKKIAQYQSQLTGLWISVGDLIKKRKEHDDFSKAEQATWDETMGKVGALQSKIEALGGVPYLTPDQRKELEDLRKQYGECDEEATKLQDALRKATNEMIFQQAAAGLDAKATLELGRALGVISEEDYAVATVLGGLNKATASTDPGAYAAQVKAIADAIDRLHNKNIEITVTTIQQEINAGSVSEHRTPTTRTPSRGYAEGGGGIVPPGYPNDSYLIGLTSGEPFWVGALAQAQKNMYSAVAGMNAAANVNMTGMGGAGAIDNSSITISPGAIVVNAAPGMDEEMVAQKVIDKVGSVLEISRSKGLR